MRKWLMEMRFRNRLLFSFLTLALLPFLFFAVVCGGLLINQAYQTTEVNRDQLINQVSTSLDMYISTIEKVANSVEGYMMANEVLETEQAWQLEKEDLHQQLKLLSNSYSEIGGILVATQKDDYVATGMERISRDSFSKEKWYTDALQAGGAPLLISGTTGRNIETAEAYSPDEVFSLAKAVRNSKGEVCGVILLDVRHDIIKEAINQVSIGADGFVFVVDKTDAIVYAPVNPVVYRIDPAWVTQKTEPVATVIEGQTYEITALASAYSGWTTIGVSNMSELNWSVVAIWWSLLLGAAFLIVLVLLGSFAMANTITKPVASLQQLMAQAEKGDLRVRFRTKHQDEVGQLGESFNHMIAQMDELIQQVYMEQKHKRDAELTALQAQIKPHFLYNTLDTIGWMARDYEAEDIVALIDALTSMFRVGLSQGRDYIPVESEVSHIKNYLYIHKIRYKDKLNYTITVDPEAQNYMTPKLILQPLVENAIYHGIKQKRGGGTIDVSVRHLAEQGVLEMVVKDNGAGLSEVKLQQLQTRLHCQGKDDGPHSFGLFYVAQRLELTYGSKSTVTMDSVEGQGTVVTLRVPTGAVLQVGKEVET